MKQTAVDWLFEKLWEQPKDKFTWYALLNEAKAIEKEQIEEAFDIACEDPDRIGKEYYDQTYKKNE
jgi:hypothetical protein